MLVTGITFVNNQATDDTAASVIFSAYLPDPWALSRQRSYKAGLSHTLIHLEPRLEILRPIKPEVWISELITVTSSSKREGSKGILSFGINNGTGLCVGFDTGIARFRHIGSDGEKRKGKGMYQNISTAAEGNNEWETSMRYERLEVYALPGLEQKPRQKKVDEMEMVGRIEGFGYNP